MYYLNRSVSSGGYRSLVFRMAIEPVFLRTLVNRNVPIIRIVNERNTIVLCSCERIETTCVAPVVNYNFDSRPLCRLLLPFATLRIANARAARSFAAWSTWWWITGTRMCTAVAREGTYIEVLSVVRRLTIRHEFDKFFCVHVKSHRY